MKIARLLRSRSVFCLAVLCLLTSIAYCNTGYYRHVVIPSEYAAERERPGVGREKPRPSRGTCFFVIREIR